MKSDIMIKNGTVVTHYGEFNADLTIRNEKITGLFSPGEKENSKEIIDATGMLIFPGIIDSHVHFNEPGRESWEGFKTGSFSAAAGGITVVIDMPLNSSPCTLNKKELERKIEIGRKNSIIDFGLWGGAIPDNILNLADLNNGGIAGFKSFLCYSGIDEFKKINDAEFIEILNQINKFKKVYGLHSENDDIVNYLSKKYQRENRVDRRAYLDSRPPITEKEAISRIIFYIKQLKPSCAIHFLHISLSDTIEIINQAKNLGCDVTVETCPHYLSLTDEDFEILGPVAKCSPPLRSKENVNRLWEYVKNGSVDVISSDHSPCTFKEKEKGEENIWKAWGGISGIQTMLPIMFSEGVIKRKLPLSHLIKMMSYNPSKLFGFYPKKGILKPGSDADIVLFNPNEKWVLKKGNLFYKNKYSPFIGKVITGKVEKTLLRGRVIYEKGEIKVHKGIGKYLRSRRYII